MPDPTVTLDVQAFDLTKDVIVLRGAPRQVPHALSDALHERGFAGLLIVLERGQRIEALDEEQMREHGWIKADASDTSAA